ncbi:MAG: hypothetical protein R3250_09790, partial [Melioribacteraceae bacterium]|nr:hypothetical protein [Melioribacteraceae bacterium]
MNQIPVILAYITILIGCSSNDDDNNDYPINGIEGTIIGEVGCTAIVFEAQITNPDHEDTTSGTIGILDVPEEFGQIGIKIRFDIRENT